MDTIEKILAERMKHFRKLKGWNQSDLAEHCGKSPSAIAQIETCVIWPAPETVRAIAQALGVKQWELFAREQIPASPELALTVLAEFIKASKKPAAPVVSLLPNALAREDVDVIIGKLPISDNLKEVFRGLIKDEDLRRKASSRAKKDVG